MRYQFHFIISGILFFSAHSVLFASSNSIRFQGRLTDSESKPISGTPFVSFSLYDDEEKGQRVWGPSPFMEVRTNSAGLFVADIGPFNGENIFSQQDLLFLEVTIKAGTNQTDHILKPRQKLSKVPFSFHSDHATLSEEALISRAVQENGLTAESIQTGAVATKAIADSSIEKIDLSTSVVEQLVPQGMVGMFVRECPIGWDRFLLMDNRFPIGKNTYTGEPGGVNIISGLTTNPSGLHQHQVNAHSHGAGNLRADPSPDFNCPLRSNGGHCLNYTNHTHSVSGQTSNSSPNTNTQGEHLHDVVSDGSWLPPHLGLVFCEKI